MIVIEEGLQIGLCKYIPHVLTGELKALFSQTLQRVPSDIGLFDGIHLSFVGIYPMKLLEGFQNIRQTFIARDIGLAGGIAHHAHDAQNGIANRLRHFRESHAIGRNHQRIIVHAIERVKEQFRFCNICSKINQLNICGLAFGNDGGHVRSAFLKCFEYGHRSSNAFIHLFRGVASRAALLGIGIYYGNLIRRVAFFGNQPVEEIRLVTSFWEPLILQRKTYL